MGKDIESWLNQQGRNGQRFNANPLRLPSDLGMQNKSIPCAIPCTNAAPPNQALPAFGYSVLPNVKPLQLNCQPHLGQSLAPNMALQEKLLPNFNLLGKVPDQSCGVARQVPKQFLVFDQTGNKTTMMFSSGVGPQMQGLSSWTPKPTHHWDTRKDKLGIGGARGHHNAGPILTDELDDDHLTTEERDGPEDSEEIDALLYSDDEGDDYSDNGGEETSTGHSPSSMTAHEKHDWFDEEEDDVTEEDEVASSAAPPIKRQKLSDSGSEDPSVTNAANSANPIRSLEYEDDAESSCAGGRPPPMGGSLPGNRRIRNEKIRQTVSLLQTIIPCGKGKGAVMVLDEVINYLRTLRSEAETLGLSSP